MFLTIISLLGVLIVLVMAHEIGHFVTARLFGVGIEEFALFMGPRLASIKRGNTIYSIRSIPIGGFVKMVGEEDPQAPGSLASKSHFARVVVLSSGAIMNALLPFLLFTVAVMIPHQMTVGKVLIDDVAAGSPAAAAGLQAGDRVLTIEGEEVRNTPDLRREIQLNLGNEVDIFIERADGSRGTITVAPRWQPPAGQGAIGIVIGMTETANVTESLPVWRAVPQGIEECIETFVLFKNSIISMFVGTVPLEVAGPVGVAQITGEAARAGMTYLIQFAAFFSINLAIINIFPLPALDGGRLAFVVLEWLRRGKRISPKTEGMVHTIGFILLIAAMLAITYRDIVRIVTGDSLIP